MEPFECSLKGEKASLDCTKPDLRYEDVCKCSSDGVDEKEKDDIIFWVGISLAFGAVAMIGFAIFLILELIEWIIEFVWSKPWKEDEKDEGVLRSQLLHWANRKLMILHSFV